MTVPRFVPALYPRLFSVLSTTSVVICCLICGAAELCVSFSPTAKRRGIEAASVTQTSTPQ